MSEEEIIGNIKSILNDFLLSKLNGLSINDEYFEAIQGLLDLYNSTKKSELLLANKFQKANIELNKEKEKNKELENCLQMAKQIMTADISEDFDCMKLKEFKEYLLNEMKLNANFEE